MNLDTVCYEAKVAAATGKSLNDACRWPFDSWEGRWFKEVFLAHREALEALGMIDKTLTPD